MELNAEQERAAAHQDGALLILAGAGAGKTRVIVERIARLIKSGVAPEKILAVTFTNKAAREMQDRIRHTLGSDAALKAMGPGLGTPFIGTFHALSLHIIKTFHAAAGLPKRFTIYDRADSLRAAREAIKAAGFDPKELEPRRVLGAMSRHKGNDVTRELFAHSYASSYIDEAIAEVWGRYDALLAAEHALDFDDILCVALKLMRTHAAARDHFQTAWSHIHVDEYQDTNRVQYELMTQLAARHRNIAVVGDVDQNIYSWRGASIEHIMNFERDYPEATVVVLTKNYRSTKTIIAAANEAIAKNIRRREKELVTDNDDGEPIMVGGFADEADEARFVAEEAGRLIRRGTNPNSIAVLYRANFQSRALEEAFLRAGIAYQVLGTRFFERAEIKDALAFIRLALNPRSVSDLARAAQATRGMGAATVAKLAAGAMPGGAAGERAQRFLSSVERIRCLIGAASASAAVRGALTESGLWQKYEHGDAEDEERLENLKELVSVASKYDEYPPDEGIQKLIEEAALQSDQDELTVRERAKQNGVKLMTVHAAKGLEFETVFVTGLEDGLFPHERDDDTGDSEEERRLFYVALTRAEKRAYLTYALTRRIFGTRSLNMASEFITELDPAYASIIREAAMGEEPDRYIL